MPSKRTTATKASILRPVAAFALLLLTGAYFDHGHADGAVGTGADRVPADVFVPPKFGRPEDRAGAGTKSLQDDSDLIRLLVPAGGGFTLLDRPHLIWRLTRDVDGTMIASFRKLASTDAGAAMLFVGPFQSGWYALDLRRSDFALAPGHIYEWKVELTPASGEHPPATKLSYVERLDAAAFDGLISAGNAAANGLWFDALAPLVSIDLGGRVRVEESERLMTLIKAAGLVADFDRRP